MSVPHSLPQWLIDMVGRRPQPLIIQTLRRLLECPQDFAADFPQSERSEREKESRSEQGFSEASIRPVTIINTL